MPRLLPTAGVPKERPVLANETARRSGGTPKPQMPKRRFVQFGPPLSTADAKPETVVVNEKPKREKKPKVKADPKHVAAARELRDRWLERVNADPSLLPSSGKYDIARGLLSRDDAPPTFTATPQRRLPAAA
jgi:hypothetical protein